MGRRKRTKHCLVWVKCEKTDLKIRKKEQESDQKGEDFEENGQVPWLKYLCGGHQAKPVQIGEGKTMLSPRVPQGADEKLNGMAVHRREARKAGGNY